MKWQTSLPAYPLALEERGQTMTGAVVGTPAFMAPEQARGEVRSLDRRTDVYSLGATLYDLLAGQPPFVAEHPWKLLAMVADEEVPALRSVAKQVPGDLETIVMKCLQREPAQRRPWPRRRCGCFPRTSWRIMSLEPFPRRMRRLPSIMAMTRVLRSRAPPPHMRRPFTSIPNLSRR
jgi:serine/threonine protein kinase